MRWARVQRIGVEIDVGRAWRACGRRGFRFAFPRCVFFSARCVRLMYIRLRVTGPCRLRSCGDECVRISFIVLRDGLYPCGLLVRNAKGAPLKAPKNKENKKTERSWVNGVTSVGD